MMMIEGGTVCRLDKGNMDGWMDGLMDGEERMMMEGGTVGWMDEWLGG